MASISLYFHTVTCFVWFRDFNSLLSTIQPRFFSRLALTQFHSTFGRPNEKFLPQFQQVAQIWQRDRASSINDFRWGSIWGYYRLMSYFSRHSDTTQFTLTHHTVNKPFLLLGIAAEHRSRRRRRWCANNIAADHQMFITLTGQLSWQRLRRSAVDLYSKAKKSLFEPPFTALRGNVRTPSSLESPWSTLYSS